MLRALLTGVAAGLITLAGTASAETLRLSNWLPQSHPIVKDVMVPWKVAVEEATEGRVTVQILDAPLGPPPAHYDLAANGVADVTFSAQAYTPGRFKTAMLAELPFLGDSAEAVSVAYWQVFEERLAAAGEYAGVKVLGVFTHGPGHAFAKGRDLSSLDGIAGAKLRVGGGMANDVATALGAVPVQSPSSKAYELISGGVVDGILFPFESVTFFRLDGLLDQGFEVPGGLYNTSFFFVMNERRWNRLSEADQAAIDSVSGEALSRLAGKAWDAADAAGRSALEGQVELHVATEEQMEGLHQMLDPVIEAKLDEIATSGIDAKAALEDMKARIAAESE
ncbi:TRAP transporter substrate-binding protein [Rhabdochromatium marinum]|uniref:TRAP transporter substrate-binding protein n=1 Tax=Rhabdochromatium marinum TaxID=48729 RepID=UPI0019062534|nr:TRAP transporter substrate-binding protein [Rhabdochromatium marinum]MBK1650198.1 ABC transporter substrate-binding protein [Rhabdochromatium marinum]